MLPPAEMDSNGVAPCFVCGHALDPRSPNFLLECHFCGRWLHGACAHVSEQDALLVAKFACLHCQQQHNHDVKYEQPISNNGPLDADTMAFAPLPVHLGGFSSRHKKNDASFRRVLGAAIFARSGVQLIPSQDVSPSFLQRSALDEPVLLAGNNHNVAGMQEPFPVIDVNVVTNLLAENRPVRTVDVATQTKSELTAAIWQARLAKSVEEDASMLGNAEFRLPNTSMHLRVAPPIAVAQVDWHNVLPNSDATSDGSGGNVNVFGVFLEANAYLDFMVAPGGQCTWLSVSAGELWVYLIRPTLTNADVFRNWKNDPDFASVFLPEQADKCIKCVVRAGSTLVVPAGWMFARFAGGVHSSSIFQGYFACTAAIEAQLSVVMQELQHDSLAQYWPETTAGWLSVDANVQLWTAVCFYVRQLLSTDHNISTRVSEHDRRALFRALATLREWSALPASLKSVNGITWTPSSSREAQAIVGRLEQALASTAPTHNLHELQPTMGLGNDSKLPPISPNEATYIYSAASAPDSCAGSPWVSGIDSTSSSFASTTQMWSGYDPIQPQQHDHLVISTQNPPYSDHHEPHHQNLHTGYGGDYGFLSLPGSGMDGNNGYMTPAGSQGSLGGGLEGLGSLGNLSDPSAFGATLSPGMAPRGYQTRLDSNGNYVDVLMRHRASCHRCGNLRKKNVRCPVCPHIFCQKCAEKMIEEHGENIFVNGCPVCKELCCCGKNRTPNCKRKFHCYKKCPATKRPAAG